jgi:hypothetical protein
VRVQFAHIYFDLQSRFSGFGAKINDNSYIISRGPRASIYISPALASRSSKFYGGRLRSRLLELDRTATGTRLYERDRERGGRGPHPPVVGVAILENFSRGSLSISRRCDVRPRRHLLQRDTAPPTALHTHVRMHTLTAHTAHSTHAVHVKTRLSCGARLPPRPQLTRRPRRLRT